MRVLGYGDCGCKDVGWVVLLVVVGFLEVEVFGLASTLDRCGRGIELVL